MANLVIDAREKFPVGTVVGAYPATSLTAGAGYDRQPSGTPVEEQTVAAGGTLTYTTLVNGTPYVLAAVVGGNARSIRVIHNQTYKGSRPASSLTWRYRVNARRVLTGTAGLAGYDSAVDTAAFNY